VRRKLGDVVGQVIGGAVLSGTLVNTSGSIPLDVQVRRRLAGLT
jgi:hypothetical protein